MAGLALAALFFEAAAVGERQRAAASKKRAVLVGSINIDITIPIARLPDREETIVSSEPAVSLATGGKGANQAIALAKIADEDEVEVEFVGVLGTDDYKLELELARWGIRHDRCFSSGLPSGQGYVMLDRSGAATSIVVSGANGDWLGGDTARRRKDLAERFDEVLLDGSVLMMLQQEIPKDVNEEAVSAARRHGVPILLDAGGEDRPIDDAMLASVDFFCPNESELRRLTGQNRTGSEEEVVEAARSLQQRGAANVLVTLGERGIILVTGEGRVVKQPAMPAVVVDATAAGDAARAAFASAVFLEGLTLEEGLLKAAAAGSLAVSKQGAVPSLPGRGELAELLAHGRGSSEAKLQKVAVHLVDAMQEQLETMLEALRRRVRGWLRENQGSDLRFASRLNSMRLAGQPGGTLDLVKRQAGLGLDYVFFNYPQHLEGLGKGEVLRALKEAGLRAGAICIRFPLEVYGLGSFTHPSEDVRERARQIVEQACGWARALGAEDVVVWPQTDGYDYYFQANYTAMWQRQVESFRKVADSSACKRVKISLEWKPTDERSRFSNVPSTAAALLLVREVGRENMGLTLDVGHMILAGENPAQSVELVGRANKLFGIQLGDAYSRLGAEDGLAFGSTNPIAALELMYWLQEVDYRGIYYFDTFPENEDPKRECQHNIRRARHLYKRAREARRQGTLPQLQRAHDALSILQLLQDSLGV
ncbi:ribokinase xylose isomerase [Chloropicon primus]|uniref:Ribokinase n=1 Tax=Chloropicon primus TaxID=1764295 RepID=A0A5B8MDD4_9CHLO|nr:ribokinase xylose isomerase [Chloropicon primus]UPQ97633.1 ribokinase xylose isomerase [Chloropicon primus]|eukprot:QDZ18423.1 ribokinase xylose isomerase [Chloropicon primus]